jgi:hypothetical protein
MRISCKISGIEWFGKIINLKTLLIFGCLSAASSKMFAEPNWGNWQPGDERPDLNYRVGVDYCGNGPYVFLQVTNVSSAPSTFYMSLYDDTAGRWIFKNIGPNTSEPGVTENWNDAISACGDQVQVALGLQQ